MTNGENTIPERTGEKPLERYIRILEVLAGFPDGVALSPISDVLGLPKATVHRLMKGLVETGMVEAVDRGAICYQLGSRYKRLLFAGATEDWVGIIAEPILRDLAQQTEHPAFVAKLLSNKVRSVAIMGPDTSVRSYVYPGNEIVPHAGASAKAILAFQNHDVLGRVLPAPLPRLTPETKTEFADLMAEFADIRRTNVAYCIGEDFVGYAGIATPILVPGQAVLYSIAVTGSIESLLNRNKGTNEALLKAAAEKLSKAMEAQLSLAYMRPAARGNQTA